MVQLRGRGVYFDIWRWRQHAVNPSQSAGGMQWNGSSPTPFLLLNPSLKRSPRCHTGRLWARTPQVNVLAARLQTSRLPFIGQLGSCCTGQFRDACPGPGRMPASLCSAHCPQIFACGDIPTLLWPQGEGMLAGRPSHTIRSLYHQQSWGLSQ